MEQRGEEQTSKRSDEADQVIETVKSKFDRRNKKRASSDALLQLHREDDKRGFTAQLHPHQLTASTAAAAWVGTSRSSRQSYPEDIQDVPVGLDPGAGAAVPGPAVRNQCRRTSGN